MVALPKDPDELIAFYRMARGAVWRYQLDQVEMEAIEASMRSVEKALPEVLSRMETTKGPWTKERLKLVQDELTELSAGLRATITDDLSTITGQAGSESALWHSNTLSLDGIVPVSMIQVTPAQFKSFFQDTPLGGSLLKDWVDRSFESSVIEAMQDDLNSGLLHGKGYRGLMKSITDNFKDFTQRDALNLARTYTQSANVAAQQAVIQANDDIVKGWQWCCTMETSYWSSGNGTCLECACLDGNIYDIGAGPPMPLHVNCRCFPLTVTKTWEEMGIDLPELDEVSRSWAEYEDMPIGAGRRGEDILEYGWHKGDYGSWFETRSDAFQLNALGPKRFELYKEGLIDFKDLTDKETGKLLLLTDLKQGKR